MLHIIAVVALITVTIPKISLDVSAATGMVDKARRRDYKG